MESHGGMILTGKSKNLERNLFTTNTTWIDPGMNLGLHGERPATNHLSQGMAQLKCYWLLLWDGVVQSVPSIAAICDLLCIPISVLITLIHPPVLSGCTGDI
jgi:hypothetical protein